MKLCYVTDGIFPYVLGGMQVVSRKHIEGLHKFGVNLVVIHSFFGNKKCKTNIPGKNYEIDWPFSKSTKKYIPGHYIDELKQYSKKVKRIIDIEKPDVIYSEGPLIYDFLKSKNKIQTIFHPHGLDMFQKQNSFFSFLKTYPLKSIVKYHAKNATFTISQGGKLTSILTNQLNVSKSKIKVLPNSIQCTADNHFKKDKNKQLKLLFIGRNDPKKGFPLLLNVMKKLKAVHLDVVGPIISTKKYFNITYHGAIKDKNKLNKFYKDCDFLVMPSYSEGMATVLLEAMSQGVPCIATDVGATSELVINNNTGWLIKPGSKAELKKKEANFCMVVY